MSTKIVKSGKGKLFQLVFLSTFLLSPLLSPGQNKIAQKVENFAKSIDGTVGVYAIVLETGRGSFLQR